MFVMARDAAAKAKYEESHRIYKDIIMAGQMMYEEAVEYIRGQIALEEKLAQYDKRAQEYFKSGELKKARKLWEKIVEESQKAVLK